MKINLLTIKKVDEKSYKNLYGGWIITVTIFGCQTLDNKDKRVGDTDNGGLNRE